MFNMTILVFLSQKFNLFWTKTFETVFNVWTITSYFVYSSIKKILFCRSAVDITAGSRSIFTTTDIGQRKPPRCPIIIWHNVSKMNQGTFKELNQAQAGLISILVQKMVWAHRKWILNPRNPMDLSAEGVKKVSLNQKKRTKLSESKDFWKSFLKVQILACVHRLNGKGGNLPKFPTAVAFKGVPALWHAVRSAVIMANPIVNNKPHYYHFKRHYHRVHTPFPSSKFRGL